MLPDSRLLNDTTGEIQTTADLYEQISAVPFGPDSEGVSTGPVLVSLDEVPDRNDLRIRTEVNGEVRQDDTTANLIFDVPALIAHLSRITTLATGDVIF